MRVEGLPERISEGSREKREEKGEEKGRREKEEGDRNTAFICLQRSKVRKKALESLDGHFLLIFGHIEQRVQGIRFLT